MTAAKPPSSSQAFWDFSLRVYAQPGVAEECLTLQERLSLDVNLLLFSAYAGAKLRLALTPDNLAELIAATEPWHIAVVRPLRATRTAMKRWSEDKGDPLAASAATLRLAVKKAELDAERIEHERLAVWAQDREATSRAEPRQIVEANIGLVLDHYARTSGNAAEMPARLIEAALA